MFYIKPKAMNVKGMFSKLIPTLLVLCIHIAGYSQSPQGFSYQGVVRNSSGAIVGNQAIGIKVIIENTSSVEYYSETQTTTTSAQGVFNITIGNGARTSTGFFKDIPWANGTLRLKIGIDITGGTSYTFLENPTDLKSVPYALYAENVKEVSSSPNATDIDPIFVVKNKTGQIVFAVYQSGVRMFVDDLAVKGSKGGFAIGGLSGKAQSDYFLITPDSARVRLKDPVGKGAKGGFAIGGLSSKSGNALDYFTVSSSGTPDIIPNSAQMLWYPLKEAFMVGRVEVLDPIDVGLNSFSSGYLSKAKGNYSQAMGTNSVASGLYATAIGESSQASGSYSFAFGSNAQATNTNNVAIGKNALSDGSSNCYAFGNSSEVLSFSSNCYALGNSSQVTSSTDCYAFGTSAFVSGGLNSYAIGSNSKVSYGNNTAWGSYAIGDNAEAYGQRAYAIGSHARALNNDALAFGTNTKSTAYVSIAIGANGSNADTTFATGQASIAMGYAANSGGSSSIALGTRSIASTNYSIGMGYQANATGANSCAFGSNTQANFTNSTAIGFGALANANNKVRIGNSSVTVIEGQVAFTSASDARLKKNVKDLSAGLDFIMKLRPVEYQMNQGDERLNYGFIAQDIEQIIGTKNSMLTIGADAQQTLGLRYTDFIAPLVKAIQEQQNQIEELKEKNKELEAIKVELEAIKAMLKK